MARPDSGKIVDAEGNPIIFRVKGLDRTMPDAVFNCHIVVWSGGGNMVAEVIDERPITVSAPPDATSYQEAEEARKARADEHFAKERAAAEMERGAAAPAVEAEVERKKPEPTKA